MPDYKVDKATIVRAVAYDDFGHHSDVKTASYFIGFSDKNGYTGIKTLSIVTDPSNLFGYETGIYVTGKAYDEYVDKYRGMGSITGVKSSGDCGRQTTETGEPNGKERQYVNFLMNPGPLF